jgi:valyl-tRNA synthetase
MSELAKSYEHSEIEHKWLSKWEESKCFVVDNPLEADFKIAFPPPNVTGELHMGHALNSTLQDTLIRYHRMLGKKVHWQVGSDHAGIGTQIVVEKQLAKEKKSKYDLGRDEFEKKVWEWANAHRGKIENQMKLLGCSADWSKSEFTLNPGYVKAVRTTFFELFKQGLIYQGTRLINWCPHCLTSLSDLEVIHEDRMGKLYKIKYELVQPDLSPSLHPSGTSPAHKSATTQGAQGEKGSNTDLLSSPFMGEGLGMFHLVVATSRPETLFGDVAVAINPEDIRYKSLIDLIKQGQAVKVKLPLTGKEIPVILSESVKLDFGTGALKITPAHDFNDQEIAKEWNANPLAALSEGTLEPINIFNEKAQLLPLEFISAEFHGLERFKAREVVLKILGEQELLLEEEKYSQAAALHDRCGNVIEPYLSKQWFVNMKPLAKLAINAYTPQPPSKGEQEDLLKVKFFPERYGKTYLDWLENIQDWCISRQLWWGHPIPVWSKPLDLAALNDSQKAEEMHGSIVNEFKRLSKEAGYTNKPTLRSDAHHPSFVIGDKKDNEYIFQYGVESAQVVLLGSDEAFEKVLELAGYKKDNDVLDTWFSSALWPFATLGWPDTPQPLYKGEAPNEKKKPWTSILMTAREIINLWVSRMIFSALKMTDRLPFTDILIHPVLQTPDGKRMSKSKGNAIDPIELVNKYGADASRLWYCSVGIFANQDTRFPGKKEKDGSWSSPELENKRRFINKLWNATKFVLQNVGEASAMPLVRKNIDQVISALAINPDTNTANLWILGRWNEVLKEANEHLENYRFAEFSKSLEDFVWDDFCDWYLELAKIDFNQQSASGSNQGRLVVNPVGSPPNPLGRGNKEVDSEALYETGALKFNVELLEVARQMRENPTAAEEKLWNEVLRSSQTSYKFTRQKPVNNFVLDFYCSELLLAIEVDGEIHNEQKDYDQERTNFLNAVGIEVIRFPNVEVLNNIEIVQKNLLECIQARKQALNSPCQGGWGVNPSKQETDIDLDATLKLTVPRASQGGNCSSFWLGGEQTQNTTKQTLIYILEQVLRAFHPIIPFVSEEIWQTLTGEQSGLAFAEYPQAVELTDEQKQIIIDSTNKIEIIKKAKRSLNSIRQKTLNLSANFIIGTSASGSSSQAVILDGISDWNSFARSKDFEPSQSIYKPIQKTVDSYLTLFIEIPESVNLVERREILEKDLNKKKDEKSKLEDRFNNPGFAKNASEETKAEMKKEMEKLNQEVNEIQEALDQVKEASRL